MLNYKHFNDNKLLFTRPVAATVKALSTKTQTQAEAFRAALRTGATFFARRECGLNELPIPATIPLAKITDYLGQAGRQALTQMQPDDIAGFVD